MGIGELPFDTALTDPALLSQSIAVLQVPEVLTGVLRTVPLLRGLTEEQLAKLVEAGRLTAHRRGEALLGESSTAEAMFVVLRGRVDIALVQASGGLRVYGQLGVGDHFGELGLLSGGKLASAALAASDVALLGIERAQFEALLRGVPAFAENLSHSLGLRLASTRSDRLTRPVPAIVALAAATPRAEAVLDLLGAALLERRAPFVVAASGDDSARLAGKIPRVLLAGAEAEARQPLMVRVAELRAKYDLVLLPIPPGLAGRPEDPRSGACEELWWILEPEGADECLRQLAALLARRPTLEGRTRLVWALHEGERPRNRARPVRLLQPELRVFLARPGEPPSRRQRLSVRRLALHLEGQRVGLALGGGGARGFAHCGVLRVLEEEGLAVDRIAGTSMGALVGLLYAAGLGPDAILHGIASETQAGFPLRSLPAGAHLSLFIKARTGAFERSITRHIGTPHFEELDFPLQTVASDLVKGELVVQSSGDAVRAVLESIRLPIFSRPVLRDGLALVDGGVLNNLPSDLLVAEHLESVLAVDVMARSAEGWSTGGKAPGLFESLVRIAELQHERLSEHGAHRADLRLRVDASRYGLTDFSLARAREIAALGEEAARNAVAELRGLVPARWRGR